MEFNYFWQTSVISFIAQDEKIDMLNKWLFLFHPSSSKLSNIPFLILVNILSMELRNFLFITWAIVVFLGNCCSSGLNKRCLIFFFHPQLPGTRILLARNMFLRNISSLIFYMLFNSVCHELISHLHCDASYCYFLTVFIRKLIYFVTSVALKQLKNKAYVNVYSALLELLQQLS